MAPISNILLLILMITVETLQANNSTTHNGMPNGHSCSLNSPEIVVRYYNQLKNVDVSTEKEFDNMTVNNCDMMVHQVPNCCACRGMHGTIVCSSLSDALLVQSVQHTQTIFLGLLSNVLLQNEIVMFDFTGNIAIASLGEYDHNQNRNIDCKSEELGGLFFKNLNSLILTNLEITNCGIMNEWRVGFTGAVQFENCLSVMIENVTFTESIGSAIVLANTESHSSDPNLTIVNCTFSSNSFGNNTSLYGGGISIYIGDACLSFIAVIADSLFHNNCATYGGSIALITNSGSAVGSSIKLLVKNTNFSSNNASKDGGAYYQLGSLISEFLNCDFSYNLALHFGGAGAFIMQSIILGRSDRVSLVQTFDKCVFKYNKASSHAVMYFFLPIATSTGNQRLSFTSVSAYSNSIQPPVYDTDNCMIYINNINVYFSNVNFMNNNGSVVCLDDAYLHLENKVLFNQNFGYRGAGVNMKGGSMIFIHDNASVEFSKNDAVYGGAIYKGITADADNAITSNCVFNFENSYEGDNQINFQDNFAKLSGSSIYLADLMPDEDTSCTDQQSEQIQQTVTNIEFNYPIYKENDAYYLDISLGVYISLDTNITSFALFYITLLKDGREYLSNDGSISLQGPAALSLSQGLILTNLYFTGYENASELQNFSLLFNLAGDHTVSSQIHLNFIPCKLGFVYSKNDSKCVCVDSPHILCNERQNLACIERGYWYGNDNDSTIIIPCYSGFCNNSYQSCIPCDLEGGGGEYCTLQNDEGEECLSSHSGLGCLYCEDSYTYTYNALKCINKSKCNLGRDITIILICSIAYLIFEMALLFFLLKLHKEKDFGYLFCIIYYYSIIVFILPNSLVASYVSLFDTLLQGVFTLNPIFLGQFDLCYKIESDHPRIVMTFLNYLYPVVITLLMALLIKLSKYFPRYIKFRDNAGVRGVCIVVLLSYTAILQTSFNIINPVRYNSMSTDRAYVSIDPRVPYLDASYPLYIFFWIIALLFIIILILPLTLFLLFSPLLMKYCNLIKIKPYLDLFHACYRDNYRWMSGFYFLNRLVYFAIIIDPNTTEVDSYPYIRYASVAIVIIHCVLQPYRSKYLNIADAVILCNIACLSLIHNQPNLRFFNISREKLDLLITVVTFIFLYIPSEYLILLLLIFAFKRSQKFQNFITSIKTKLKDCFTACIDRLQSQRKRQLLEESDSDSSFNMDYEFAEINTADPRESILFHMEEQFNEPRKSVSKRLTKSKLLTATSKRPSTTLPSSQPAKPQFSELEGPGLMSPSQRKGSFLVQYVKYKQNRRETQIELTDVVEVTGKIN